MRADLLSRFAAVPKDNKVPGTPSRAVLDNEPSKRVRVWFSLVHVNKGTRPAETKHSGRQHLAALAIAGKS
eukprot:1986631-Alexandrium_andersonii.AAC.1